MRKNSNSRDSRPVTISDVAKAAAVSTSTVSNVINNARYIRAETREQVERVMKELGYRPNKLARAMVQHQTRTIGMVIPDNSNPFFSELIHGVEDILTDASYFVSFGNSDNDRIKEKYYINGFMERQVDGLIIAIASETENEELLALSAHKPIVLVDRLIPGWNGNCVMQDNELGMQLAIDHLVSLGHRMIALVNGDISLSTAKERLRSFDSSLQSFGLSPTSVSDGTYSVDSGYMQTVSLLHNLQRPTAICAANDLLAIGAMRAIFEANLRVPEDISVIGHDDIAFASYSHPSLTTISQPTRSIGTEAARLMLKRLSNPHEIPQRIIMAPKIIIRQSTSKPVRA